MDEAPQRRWELDEGDPIVAGRFVVERLGGGSEYEAFLAWDEPMMALVVAKCLRPHLVEDADALRRLRREADYLLNLRHPVVVRGFDVVLDGPRPHVVMEHLEGPNLASLLRRYGALELHQLLPLALQICGALHYLHSREVVHLDVKPRNTIMSAPPRLIDLSVARPTAAAARLRSPLGTDAYMAPEQCDPAASPGAVGPPSDVWGLGATLHHAIAGDVPFPRNPGDRDSDDPLVRFPQLHRPPRPLPTGTPPDLVALVGAALEADPALRPSAEELALGLEPLAQAVPRRTPFARGRKR